MTVYWVDPYLESSGGGIHGTTGNGSGTYASPWKLSHLLYHSHNSNSKIGVLDTGDEVRFKGLPFADFFGSSQAWTSTSSNPTQYSHGTFNRQFMYAIRKDTGEKYYKAQYSSYNQFRFVPSGSTWNEHFPLLDISHGVKVMPTSKSISQSTIYSENGNNTNMYFLDPRTMKSNTGTASNLGYHGITVTAGWVSETSQTGGMTIIHCNANRSDSQDYWYWGGSTDSHTGIINWDCRNTLILAHSQYMNPRIYGGDVKLEAFKAASYQPGYPFYIYSSGDVDVGHIGGGGYSYIYHFMRSQSSCAINGNKHTYEFKPDRWTMGYSSQQYYTYWPSQNETDNFSDTTTRTAKSILRLTDGQYGWQIYDQNASNPGNMQIIFPNTYHHSKRESGHKLVSFNAQYKTITETIGTPSTHVGQFSYNSNVEENSGYGGLGANPYNNASFANVQNTNGYKLVSNSNSLFSAASTDTTYRSFATDMSLIDSSLELAQGNPLNFNSTPNQRLPYKTTVLRNDKDYRPLTLVSPENNAGPSIAQFNSPSNSNKLVWHFFNNNNGNTYSDNYALQIPDYSSNNLRLNWDVTHTSGLGVTFAIELWYVKNAAVGTTGNTYPFNSTNKLGPYSPTTTTSTTAVFATTISSSDLIDANPKYMWAFCKITKGNNTVGNVIFNQLDLTQIT